MSLFHNNQNPLHNATVRDSIEITREEVKYTISKKNGKTARRNEMHIEILKVLTKDKNIRQQFN